MKLVGKLKEKTENANTLDEDKQTMMETGLELTEDELDDVTGGAFKPVIPTKK